jgi:hypothetical protein
MIVSAKKSCFSPSAVSMHAKSSVASFANVWHELGGRRGLRSTHLCAHAMVIDLIALLSVHELTSSPIIIHHMLHLIIHGLTLMDSEW